jgi:ubiquinol-cytochrome c reductase cytochrome c subunit
MMLRSVHAAVAGASLAAIAALSVTLAAQDTAAPPAPTAHVAPAGSASRGKTLYMNTGCYQCHSEQGQGGTQGPRLGPKPIPFQAFLRYLRSPRGEMPPYRAKVMSDRDVADVYAFLEALPPPPPLGSLPLLQP